MSLDELRTIVRRVASAPDVIAAALRAAENQPNGAKTAKQAISLAIEDFGSSHSSRVAAAIAIGVASNATSLRSFERKGLFFRLTGGRSTSRKVVERLMNAAADPTRIHPTLAARLQSYKHLHDLAAASDSRFRWYRAYLRKRPPGTLKALLAAVEVRFFEGVADVTNLSERLPTPARARHAEYFAEVASMIFAEALEVTPFAPIELDQSIANVWKDEDFVRLLHVATLRHELRRVAKLISALGYQLERPTATTFVLSHADPTFDQARQLSTIVHMARRQLRALEPGPPAVSVHDFMAATERVEGMAMKLHFEPYERFVFQIPGADVWPSGVLDGLLSEDVSQLRDDTYEFILGNLDPAHVQLTEALSLQTYVKLYHRLRAFTLMQSGMLARQVQTAPDAVANSLVIVSQEKDLEDALGGLDSDFLETISWAGSNDGHLDLQYAPILRLAGHFVVCPRLLMGSSPFRNVLARYGTRFEGTGDQFVDEVAALLKSRFEHVAIEKGVSRNGQQTDADVAVYHEGILFLFECKYSLPSASGHEDSDHWSDVQTGVTQLCKLVAMLREDPGLKQRLRSWFPDARIAPPSSIEFRPCVLASNRTLSGWQLDGVPIRHFFGLKSVIREGKVRAHERSAAGTVTHSWSFWKSQDFCVEDLEDYLSEQSRLVAINRIFCSEIGRVNYQDKELTLAERTTAVAIPNHMQQFTETYGNAGLRYLGAAAFPA
jgi:hypothetical protein